MFEDVTSKITTRRSVIITQEISPQRIDRGFEIVPGWRVTTLHVKSWRFGLGMRAPDRGQSRTGPQFGQYALFPYTLGAKIDRMGISRGKHGGIRTGFARPVETGGQLAMHWKENKCMVQHDWR